MLNTLSISWFRQTNEDARIVTEIEWFAGNPIMNLQLKDACIDLEESDEEAGVYIAETLAYCKANNPQCYTDFKKDFFKIASQFREREWRRTKVRHSKSLAFKKRKVQEHITLERNEDREERGANQIRDLVNNKDINLPDDQPAVLSEILNGVHPTTSKLEEIGILVTDQSLSSKYGQVNISNLKPVQYGGIILSEDEEQAMMLHPKMICSVMYVKRM